MSWTSFDEKRSKSPLSKSESHSGANGSHHLLLHMIVLTPQFALIAQQSLVPAAWKGNICWCTRCKLSPSLRDPSSAWMRTLAGLWRLASWSSPPDLMGHKALGLGLQVAAHCHNLFLYFFVFRLLYKSLSS